MNGPSWLNLPSSDLARAKKFYSAIGFSINPREIPHMVSMSVGDNKLIVNIIETETFNKASGNQAKSSNETLISLGAASHAEVDEFAKKTIAAGGTVYAQPGFTDGWYGCGIIDPDGHRWNALYMDMSKMS